MNYLKTHADKILLCLFECIVGILLFVNPIGFTSWIIMATGIILIFHGLVAILNYFRSSSANGITSQSLTKGLVMILAGCFCAFRTDWFIATFPALTILYGIVILLTGLGKIQLTIDMLRQKNRQWSWAALNACISIICAIVILSRPFASTAVLWMFTGASLLAEGILDMIVLFRGKRHEEEAKQ